MTGVLIDTNVIIDYLRGSADAIAYIDSLTVQPATSAVVVAELYAGVREGVERRQLERLLGLTTLHSLTESIAVLGGLLRRQYGKSHNVGLEDALIAATAQAHGLTLVTLNRKHFPMLTNLVVPY